jgi:tRNA (guanine26-N2/guanine27-N2)-dimethyltransferase
MFEERGVRVFAETREEPDSSMEVFFNYEMLENRDLSEAAFRTFAEEIAEGEIHTLDATAASGIRGLRYADFSDHLSFCDPSPSAAEAVERGIEANSVRERVEQVSVEQMDANLVMSENRGRFHLIDVDPYGPFSGFLDSAARAASHSSFVGFTATDVAAPAGSYPTVCERRYGSKPLKNSFMHETALRIYIHEVFKNFARYDKAFDPKLCFQHRHYCRVMGRVTESKSRCNRSLDEKGYLSFCPDCRWRRLERAASCGNCGCDRLKVAGPLWTGKIADSRFTEKVLGNVPESWESSRTLLERIHGESEIKRPFYSVHEMASLAGTSSPKRNELLERIEEIGYPVARSHFDPQAFKTTMPVDQLTELVGKLARS